MSPSALLLGQKLLFNNTISDAHRGARFYHVIWRIFPGNTHEYAYIFRSLSLSQFLDYFCDAWLYISLKRTWFWRFLLSFGGFRHLEMIWSIYPHLKHLGVVHSVRCLSESPAALSFYLSFLIFYLETPMNMHISFDLYHYHCSWIIFVMHDKDQKIYAYSWVFPGKI